MESNCNLTVVVVDRNGDHPTRLNLGVIREEYENKVKMGKVNVLKRGSNEDHITGMEIADRINCFTCDEYGRVSNSTFRKKLKFCCDLCYKNYFFKSKLEWMKNLRKLYKSCLTCKNGFSNNLNIFIHDCKCEKHFCCNDCGIIFNQKRDIVRHVKNCDHHKFGNTVSQKIERNSSFVSCNTSSEDNGLPINERQNKNISLTGNVKNKNLGKKKSEKNDKNNQDVVEKPIISLGNVAHKCGSFTKGLKSRSIKNRHLISQRGEKLFSCKQCDRSFSLSISLKQHVRIHSGERPFVCKFCNKSFTRNEHLKKHLRIHTGEKPFTCKYCYKSFAEKRTLNNHVLTHTGEKRFSCRQCNKSFTKGWNLKQHLRTHTGEKPFKCRYCDKSFTGSGSLKKHSRTHTGEKPYTCNHCDKSFTESGSLNKHIRTHTGEKIFTCYHCKRSFIDLGSLNRHIRIHTGEKPYTCNHCNKSFTESGSLKKHVLIHTGEKPLTCLH